MKVKPAISFGLITSKMAMATARSSFELQFMQMQNSIAKRINAEIEKINNSDDSEKKLNAIGRNLKKLDEALPALEKFRMDNRNNSGRLERLVDLVSTTIQSFNADGTVDSSEVAAFEDKKTELLKQIDNLRVATHPDFVNTRTINRLKDLKTEIGGLTLTVGALDAPNTNPPTNGNRAVADYLTGLQQKFVSAQKIVDDSASMALDMNLNIQKKKAGLQTQMLEIGELGQARKMAEIEKVKEEYSNLLRTISLSFEISAQGAEALAKQLEPQTPKPGTIMNLFS